MPQNASTQKSRREAGNIFIALFGAVAMVGVLGYGITQYMRGPLATSVNITRMNMAESQMMIASQVAVMTSASQANSGDCDSDGFIEPIRYKDATPKPTGGGQIPDTLGVSKQDPWNTAYGYCVWDHGPSTLQAACQDTGHDYRLAGGNVQNQPVLVILSAGKNKVFETSCNAWVDANADNIPDTALVDKPGGSDDVIVNYTYAEALGLSGGLWSLKTGDPDTAVIDKKLEIGNAGSPGSGGLALLSGGLLLPDETASGPCNAANAEQLRRNTGTDPSTLEICSWDGSSGTWEAVSSGGGTGTGTGLWFSPTNSVMNVDGSCGNATCYSANQTFTLTNDLGVASATLSVTLSNTTNFEKVSDNCNGVSVGATAPGNTCQVVVRAKATGNVSYAGTLNVVGNNSPLATLSGTGSNFPSCNALGAGPGGYYVGCNVGGSYNLVITPSGCTGGTTNPTCAGGADTYTAQAMPSNTYEGNTFCCASTGLQNTVDLMAYAGGTYSFPAANYCSSLVYGGYDDWFLPSSTELQTYFYPYKATVGAAAAGSYYWSSTKTGGTAIENTRMLITDGALSTGVGSTAYYVRCMRRDPAATLSPSPDTTPVITPTTGFNTSYGTTAAETRTSNTITVYGLIASTPISITGGTGAAFSIDGGAYTSTATTVRNGQTVTLHATSPAAGNESNITLTIGTVNYTWLVRTMTAGRTVRVFTTSAVVTSGNLGGTGGADSICTTRATTAGLGGSWTAVLMGSTATKVETRLPWNWTILNNMAGATVATSLPDFMDGSISAAMNFSETGGVPGSSLIFTGLDTTGTGSTTADHSCASWTSTSASYANRYGDSGQMAGGAYFYIGASSSWACDTNLRRLLCMER